MSDTAKGYGQEFFGDPFGGGGPIHLVRARAIASHVVRVVFSEEPVGQSPSGFNDAFNPANYQFDATVGQVIDPATGLPTSIVPVGCDTLLQVSPAIAVLNAGEFGVDVHADRAFVAGLTYSVTVANILSRTGGGLGAPTNASFVGIMPLVETRPLRQPRGFADIANTIEGGSWIIDASGDLAPDDGMVSLRKRIFRRIGTIKAGFSFLPNYGVGVKVKEVASLAQIAAFKSDILQQVKREPEVVNLTASLTLDPTGIVYINLAIQTVSGAPLNLKAQRLADGSVVNA